MRYGVFALQCGLPLAMPVNATKLLASRHQSIMTVCVKRAHEIRFNDGNWGFLVHRAWKEEWTVLEIRATACAALFETPVVSYGGG